MHALKIECIRTTIANLRTQVQRGRLRMHGPYLWLPLFLFALASGSCSIWQGNPGQSSDAARSQDIATVRVTRQEFKRTRRIHGTVEPVRAFIVMAPRLSGPGLSTLLITKMARAGTQVQKGELLVEFDMQNQRKIVLDRQAEYRDLVEQIRKKRAQQEADRAHEEFEFRQALNNVESARLETKKNEVLIRIDAEKNDLNLEEAQARVSEIRRNLQLRREAAAAEVRILEIQRDRALNAAEYAGRNIERMRVTAPLSGLVALMPLYKTGRMAEAVEGDEIRAGVPFMRVVDSAAMQVRARINQADVYDLALGQHAEMRLDAFPDLVFRGRLEELAVIATSSALASTQSRYVRTFAALFSIDGSHPKLMPDLSIAVDVELDRKEEALVIPRESILQEHGRSYVNVLHEGRFERQEVSVGEVSDLDAVIETGLEEGALIERRPDPRQSRVADHGEHSPALTP